MQHRLLTAPRPRIVLPLIKRPAALVRVVFLATRPLAATPLSSVCRVAQACFPWLPHVYPCLPSLSVPTLSSDLHPAGGGAGTWLKYVGADSDS